MLSSHTGHTRSTSSKACLLNLPYLTLVLMGNSQVRNVRRQFRNSKTMRIPKLSSSQSPVVVLGKIPLHGSLTFSDFYNRLDLTAASVAYILEPQWNPMMEEQALSRIHRLGQRKEVRTIRYRICNSLEEVSYISTI